MPARLRSLIATLAVLALAGCGAQPAEPAPSAPVTMHVDGPVYGSLDQLDRDADVIASLEIVSSKQDELLPEYSGDDPSTNPAAGAPAAPSSEDIRDGAVPITVHTVRVVDVLRGAGDGEELTLIELGGSKATVQDRPKLTDALGPDTVAFLTRLPDGRYEVLGQGQGLLQRRDDQYVSLTEPRISVDERRVTSLR